MASVADAFNTFFWITFVFFIAKYNMAENDGTGDTKWALGYLILMIILMYYVNGNMMSSSCGGSADAGVVFRATFLPWILIFGVVMAVLIAAPGWKAPFSNTVGYLVVKMSGGEKALLNILNEAQTGNCPESDMNGGGRAAGKSPEAPAVSDAPPGESPSGAVGVQGGGGKTYRRRSRMVGGAPLGTEQEQAAAFTKEHNTADDVICMVYHDPGPLINQFTVDDFPVGVLKIQHMLKPEISQRLSKEGFPEGPLTGELEPLQKFRKMIYLKDMVAEWVWYVLTGSVVLATSDNIILNSGCPKSVDDQTDYHEGVMAAADAGDTDAVQDQVFTDSF